MSTNGAGSTLIQRLNGSYLLIGPHNAWRREFAKWEDVEADIKEYNVNVTVRHIHPGGVNVEVER